MQNLEKGNLSSKDIVQTKSVFITFCTKRSRRISLRIVINDENAKSARSKCRRKINGTGCFTNPSFLICHRNDSRLSWNLEFGVTDRLKAFHILRETAGKRGAFTDQTIPLIRVRSSARPTRFSLFHGITHLNFSSH